jgi:uncharacterized protein (DUF1800 family)
MIERDPNRAWAAHLLRRSTLNVNPARIDEFAALGWDGAVDALLSDAGPAPAEEPPEVDDWTRLAQWWVSRMVDPSSGLRDRLAWFWHGLLTTGADKVSDAALVRQQLIDLRAGAMGDYRSLLHGYVTSGALLEFLDASWSMASSPNENLARELMELFTVGRGGYTQDDVRSAARALAGWVVEDGEVTWRRENAFVAPLLFMGVQDDWDTAKVVDFLCDQPATAARVGCRLWRQLVGTELAADQAADLGRWWQDRDLAIADLVERILRDPAMITSRLNRARSGLEWFTAFRSVLGSPPDDVWPLDALDQMPYRPPNVGGWAEGPRWLSPGSLLARGSLAFGADYASLGPGRSGTTADILDRCGLQQVSPATMAALDGIQASDELPPESALHTKWRLALSSPEFNLS